MRTPSKTPRKTKPKKASDKTTAVAVQGAVPTKPAAVSEVDALCALVERLSVDPTVDVAKFREMMDLRKELRAEGARWAFEDAYIDMQPMLPSIDKSGRIVIDEKIDGKKTGQQIVVSQYAKWDNINDIITPILHKNDFSLRFDFERDQTLLTTLAILTHRSGHFTVTRSPPLPIDATGSKNITQGWGSTSSYGKRYAATAALNIRTHDMPDTNGAGPDADGLPKTISADHASDLSKRLEAVGANIPKFCQYFKIARISDLSPKDYQKAIDMVQTKENLGA